MYLLICFSISTHSCYVSLVLFPRGGSFDGGPWGFVFRQSTLLGLMTNLAAFNAIWPRKFLEASPYC